MLVYRDATGEKPSAQIVAELLASLEESALPSLESVLRISELECALFDVEARAASTIARCNDLMARAFLARDRALGEQARSLVLGSEALPERLELRRPEGYAYYALDPCSYASMAREYAAMHRGLVLVIGVRSIGTSLSALVCAELTLRGATALRCSVRPTGHPYDRRTSLRADDELFVRRRASELRCIVVDEGPGLSGSSFLSVAEALVELGIAADCITLFASHTPDVERLLARDAARRFARFELRAPESPPQPERTQDLSAGAWRAALLPPNEWPATWARLERLKYRTADCTIHKFAGYAPYSAPVRRRAELLADAGWSPAVSSAAPGFLAFDWASGRTAQRSERRTALPILADYIAFRARNLRSSEVDAGPLETMLRSNVREALGLELPALALDVRSPVEVDGRLMPHEWLVDGVRWLKTDSADHADDHLFPGPADAAWDLAGASVEWELDGAETEALLARFRSRTGDDASQRLGPYVLAYCAFRLGVAAFAAAESTSDDQARWQRAADVYRARLCGELLRIGPSLGLSTQALTEAVNGAV